jgi:hypothetical protein
MRTANSLFAVVIITGTARAESHPTFDGGDCNGHATHVLVVNKAGKVLEVWRGECKIGTQLPLEDFKIKPEHDLKSPLDKEATGRGSGNRMVLFLTTNGPKYGRGLVVQGWAAADRCADFSASTVWIEDGKTYTLTQFSNPGSLYMAAHHPEEAEAKLKATVEEMDRDVRHWLLRAGDEKNLTDRAKLLAEVVLDYPAYGPTALAEMAKCGADAMPTLRSLLYPDRNAPERFGRTHVSTAEFMGYPSRAAAYRALAAIGEPACSDLVRLLKDQMSTWKYNSDRLERFPRFEYGDQPTYDFLVALTSNPAAFAKMTDAERSVLLEFRVLWVGHPYLSTLGKEGDCIHNRLEKAINAWKK